MQDDDDDLSRVPAEQGGQRSRRLAYGRHATRNPPDVPSLFFAAKTASNTVHHHLLRGGETRPSDSTTRPLKPYTTQPRSEARRQVSTMDQGRTTRSKQ